MHCAICQEETSVDPCEVCGGQAVLRGRYRLEDQHGVLGYLALDLEAGAMVAVEGWPASAHDGAARESRVARLLRLDHPAVPRFVDGFALGDRYWLVQEYEPSEPAILSGPQGQRSGLAFLAELLGVLAELHARGVPHGTLSPSRVLRREDGSLALVGWAIPALGETVGVLGYAAPEQVAGSIGPAADLYAAGALAVRQITGRRPDKLGGAWVDDVVPDVVPVLSALLSEVPGERPTAAEALERVRRLLHLGEPGAEPIGRPPRRPGPGHGLVRTMLIIALVGGLVTAVIPLLAEDDQEPQVVYGTISGAPPPVVTPTVQPPFELAGVRLGQEHSGPATTVEVTLGGQAARCTPQPAAGVVDEISCVLGPFDTLPDLTLAEQTALEELVAEHGQPVPRTHAQGSLQVREWAWIQPGARLEMSSMWLAVGTDGQGTGNMVLQAARAP